MIDNKISIKGDEKVDIQRGAIGHRAIWMGLIYTKAREAGKAEEIEKFIREAITQTGLDQGKAIKANCTNPTSCANFFDTMFSSTLEKSFEVEVKEKSDDKLDMEFHHCPLLEGWKKCGFDDATCEKLCDIAMDGDRNIAKAMGFDFLLRDNIADGCKTCQITFSKKK